MSPPPPGRTRPSTSWPGGRGCLFAGLPDGTYGSPTAPPWAVDPGDGIGRHPVQVYESLAMTAFLAGFLFSGLTSSNPSDVAMVLFPLVLGGAPAAIGFALFSAGRRLWR